MKLIPFLVALVSASLLPACSSMKITPGPNQKVHYFNGVPAVLSVKPKSQVGIKALGSYDPNNSRPAFEFYFINKSKNYVDFGPENIIATDASGKRLKVYTRDELVSQAKSAAAWRNAAVAFSAGMQSAAASMPSTTNYSGGYYGNSTYSGASNYGVYNRYGNQVGSVQGSSYGRGTQSGTMYGSSTTYNPAQAAAANAAISANASNQVGISQQQLAGELQAASAVLGRTTVGPNQIVSGLVVTKKAPTINLKTSVAGDTHDAVFFVK